MKNTLRHWFSGGRLTPLNLLLVLIAGILAAYWTWSIWEASRTSKAATSSSVVTNGSAPATAANAHLFGQPGQAAQASPASIGQRLKLVGTSSGTNERSEFALIAIDGGRPSPFAKGAEVLNGVVIREVATDHVMLAREGTVERLELSTKTGSASPVVYSSSPHKSSTTTSGIPTKP
ncbi:MAG: Type secretion system protein [Proteobacteria bacterium]|nr:Type secretion system protein [Pseudomonadota bacterium]